MTSVLSLVNDPRLERHFSEILKVVRTTQEACDKLSNLSTKVLITDIKSINIDDIQKILAVRQHLQFVIFDSLPGATKGFHLLKTLVQMGAMGGYFDATSTDFAVLESLLKQAIERYDQRQQDFELNSMREGELQQLNSLARQLEGQSELEAQKLQQAKQRMQNLKQKLEVLQGSLMAIHQSQSLSEIEIKLNQILVKEFDLEWIRVFFGVVSNFADQMESSEKAQIHRSTFATEHSVRGTLVAAKKGQRKWTSEEKNLMDQISSAVLLAYEKLVALQKAEQFKQQWETTFDSIEIPLGLIAEDKTCVRANKAFAKAVGLKLNDVIGKKLLDLFPPQTNPDLQKFDSTLVLDLQVGTGAQTRFLRGIAQALPRNFDQALKTLILFDVTEKRDMERIIFHNAKMAEIGTIGSSMAHELNNPIGGMLTFTQLIKKEVDPKSPVYQDILSIEDAINRARDIVQTLLGFSRKPDLFERAQFSIKDLVSEAIELVRIHSRSLGIEIQIEAPMNEVNLTGSPSLLTQAIYDVLMQSYHNVLRRKFKENRYLGTISLRLTDQDQTVVLQIVDDGVAPEGADFRDLGLSVAKQIFADHSFAVEISSSTNAGMLTKITMPRPEI